MKAKQTTFGKGIHAFWSRTRLKSGAPQLSKHPKRIAQNGQATAAEIPESLECSSAFNQWLVVADDVSRHEDIRSAARAEARKQATSPVELVELYFRATPKEERSLARKIKAIKASRAEWVKVLFEMGPCKLSEFIITHRIGRWYLQKLYKTALNGEKVHFAEHLGIRTVRTTFLL